jgi:phosphoglycolate phosphatase
METLVCFDLDGPILDVSERYYRLYSDFVKLRQGQLLSKEVYWGQKRRRIQDTAILQESGLRDNSVDDYFLFRDKYIESPSYLQFDTIWPGVLELLGEFRGTFRLLLVTLRNRRENLLWQLRMLDILSFFEEVPSMAQNCHGNRSNIKAELVLDIVKRKSFSGWIIGDTETDILAGKALRLMTVGVGFGIRAEELLAQCGPDYLLRSPLELVTWIRQNILTCGE